MLKGGVFGFGGVGQHMTRNINIRKIYGDDVRIVAAVDRGEKQRELASSEFGLKAYENVDQLISHGLDFMLIVSTSHAHHPAAMACAKAKIPFLIEKPLALNINEAREIVAATEAAGVINAVHYTMRYVPAYQKMKQYIDSGQLGKILKLWAASFRGYGLYISGDRHPAIANPKESGGWIVHHMCHIVDWAAWMGGPIEEVYTLTQATTPPELDSEELIVSTLKFKNGAIGVLNDQVGCYHDHAAGVIGTLGGVGEINEGPKQLLRLHLESDDWRPGFQWSTPRIVDPEIDVVREDGPGHFLRCLRENRPTSVPVREALYSLEVCFAMRKSAHERRAVKVGELT